MQISEKKTETAQANIFQGKIRTLVFPLPPLAEQHEIVRRVEGLFAIADTLELRCERAEAHIDRLTQSILAKAFRGQLVPTEAALAKAEGQAYETAEELLVRIKEQQNGDKPTLRRQRKVAVRRG
jgi:type I restriction enzyme S subunit